MSPEPPIQSNVSSAVPLSVVDVIRNILSTSPNSVATVHDGSTMTYAELNEYAAYIATQLIELELQTEQTVGICLDRSHDAIAAMIGSWMASGAFVPLDPEYPDERLRYMVDDADVQVIITNKRYSSLFHHSGVKLILLDSSPPLTLAPANLNHLHSPTEKQLAYIMYTSGSTGNPKGVPIEHGALLNYCCVDADVYQLSADDRTLQFSTISFDIAIEEIFPPLTTGGCVVIRPTQRVDAKIELSALVEQYGITAIHLATGYWHEWVDLMVAAKVQVPASLRLMVVTGEKVSAVHYRRWREIENQPVLWANAYGPTETTVTATVFIPPANWYDENLPIGKPISGYTAYILNDQHLPVENAETGELYIGGAGLARGYVNRSDLTEQSFVEIKTGNGSTERLYRTGDLARWLPSGDIAYAGRIGHQLKIGSYRVEPGEIEATINQFTNVMDSLVTVDQSANRQVLLAYIACDTKQFDLEALYQGLQHKLPPHLVPLKYVLIESIPKKLNGKTDRKSLPSGATAIHASQTNYSAPQTDTEKQLAKIWASQLSLIQVSREDDFFALGGDSLLAIRTISSIQTHMGISVNNRDFFANTRLSQLASFIDACKINSPMLKLMSISAPFSETPLAASQLRLWLQYEKTKRNLSLFHVHKAVHIKGKLNDALLVSAIHKVIARHSALHMQVINRDTGPVMRWSGNFELPIRRETLPDGHSIAHYVEHFVESSRFELDNGSMVRACLARLTDDEHIFIILAHNIAADRRSISILLREISTVYAGEKISPSPHQFIEFAEADSELRKTGAYLPQLNYWKTQLADLEPVDFYHDFTTPASRSFSTRQIDFELSTETLGKLLSTAKNLNSPADAVLMASYFALLQRHTRSDDITVATAVHGRNNVQLENIVGTFTGTLPIRSSLDYDQSFSSLVHSLRDITRDAISNSDVYFDEIVQSVNPHRVEGQLPFSPFMFLMQNIPDNDLKLNDVLCEHIVTPVRTGEYDIQLEFSVVECAGEPKYKARLIYSEELFLHGTIERFSQQYQQLLTQALEKPNTRLRDLQLLSKEETRTLVYDFNPKREPYENDKNFVELIWHHAETNPEKNAVCDDSGNALSYHELTTRADQLAIHLQSLGASPNVLIALSMNRSVYMVVALLGILRSGSSYLPLDPAYPAERVRYILEDAKAPLLITEQVSKSLLPTTQAKILCLDSDWSDISATAKGGSLLDKTRTAGMTDLAYVIYTSGSTGNPKGVKLAHRNVLNFLLSMKNEPGIESKDRLLAVTTLSFDISVLELFLPLISGAQLVVASRDLAIDGARLAKFLDSEEISILQATPTTWRLLLESGWHGCTQLKGLMGGEAMPADILPNLMPLVSSLWNMYGPTETTVWSTCQKISKPSAKISIGKPINNTRVYILDQQQKLCPLGVPGELCIAGDGVSLGYSNREDLNATQFLPDPFVNESDARIYRTGDLARWNEDGCLSYLGRLDNLVKLNGYRIELGEIESILSSHEDVLQSAVMVREDSLGNKRLVAYWVADKAVEPKPETEQFQKHLENQLPAYMIPHQFVCLSSMPQTPNGKVDRKALPEPAKSNRAGERPSLENAMQHQLAAQWKKLIGDVEIDPTSNFFKLGGHSLAATRFIHWVEKNYRINLPMRNLIMGSLSQVAARLDPKGHASEDLGQFDSNDQPEFSAQYILNEELQLYCSNIRSKQHNVKALLFVTSHGYEQARSDRSYRSLALELANKNVHSMRVDLSGTGNSSLACSDIDSLQQWRSDILCAANALLSRSGCSSISMLASRFSASLLDNELLKDTPVESVFLWDPVTSGFDWWQARLQLYQDISASGYYYLKPRQLLDPEGLKTPGSTINSRLRAEIDSFKLDPKKLDKRFHILKPMGSAVYDYGFAETVEISDRLNWFDTVACSSTDIESTEMRKYVLTAMVGEKH